MIEIDEILYRWCKRRGKKNIAKNLGISVNTVKEIINQAIGLGLDRDNYSVEALRTIALQLIAQRQKLRASPNSVQSRIKSHHEALAEWLKEKDMIVIQMIRLLAQKKELVSETSL